MPPNAKDYFYKRWGMGRGPLETLLSFPQRAWHRLRLEDMSIEEKDHACFSNEMYKEPARRYTELRGGYTLLTDEIPATSVRSAVPLNDKRWAVYRAPNQVDHVLAFRGSADMEDMRHDVNLGQAFGEHDYMVDATVWSLRVMLMLASQHDGEAGINLKFSVTGHSLGGAVAMVVMLMLYDIPATAQHLESPDFPRFRQDVADTWHAAIVARGSAAPLPPYELVGGHIFNPGAIPDVPGEREAAQFLAKWGVKAATGVTIGLGAAALAMYLYGRHRARLSDSVDKRVTTHHILGDLLSCSFRMGAEKSYMAKDKRARQLLTASSPGKIGKEWGCHSIANFLDETSLSPKATWDAEVGPIWSEKDAEMKAGQYINNNSRLEWTGQWCTTQQGKMSVIEVRWSGPGRDVEVGPIWSQRDFNLSSDWFLFLMSILSVVLLFYAW